MPALNQALGITASNGAGATMDHTTTAAAAANTLVVAGIGWWASATPITLDGFAEGSNNFTMLNPISQANYRAVIAYRYYAAGLASGSLLTATFSTAGSGSNHIHAMSFTGVDSVTPFDKQGGRGQAGVTAWSTSATGDTPTKANALMVAFDLAPDADGMTSTASGITINIQTSPLTTGAGSAVSCYAVIATPASSVLQGTWGTASDSAAAMAIFNGAAVTGPPNRLKRWRY